MCPMKFWPRSPADSHLVAWGLKSRQLSHLLAIIHSYTCSSGKGEMSNRVMGIDPGLTRMGIGIVDQAGGGLSFVYEETISTGAAVPTPQRLKELFEGLVALMKSFSPDSVSLERVFLKINSRTAVPAMQAAGVAMLAAEMSGAAVFEYSPAEMKMAISGSGSADKKQVRFMVNSLLGDGVAPESSDATDALALAICHINSSRLRRNLEDSVKRASGGSA
jgi:crossover junction endodeoxyribonuclease RuvC